MREHRIRMLYQRRRCLRHFYLRALTVLGLIVASLASHAEPASALILDKQRKLYDQALQALANGQRNTFKQISAELTDYPLYPYLEYAELSTRIHLAAQDDIAAFLTRYPTLPVAHQLRHRWLEQLRSKDRWRDYLQFYEVGGGTTEQNCYYQLARYRNGERQPAIDAALKLWNVGKSQPKVCDKLFEILIDHKLIDEEIAWQRFTKAVLNHQHQLARYLKRFFTSNHYQSLADLFYNIDYQPTTLENLTLTAQQAEALLPAIEHGIIHRARHNPLSAMAYWSRYQQMYEFSAAAENTIISALVKSLFEARHEIADSYLKDNRYKVDASLLEWRIRQAIGEAAWQDVLDWIALLPAEYQQDARWRYWAVRAKELQSPDNPERYREQYAQLANNRNYYSFLASDQAGLGYNFQHQPSAVLPEAIAIIEARPAFQRIRELLYHKEMLYARREWFQATRNFNETEWLTAAHLATAMEWHSKAIESMIKAGYWDDIEIRFPLVHQQFFAKQARENQIELSWLFAIARQESSLATDAISPAGARGLMQLMPGTASQVAAKHNITYQNERDLYRPDLNIQLGSRYFRQMLDRYNNNRVLATAAYNAGPSRVDRWLKKTAAALPIDAWIEQIPFLETRNYVQNVMAFATIYRRHLKQEQAMLDRHEAENLL